MSAADAAVRAPRLARGDHRLTMVVLSLGAIAYGLLQCFAIPALPEIQHELHATPNATSWVLTAFLLSASVLTPILGRLGYMYGKERLLLIALTIMSLGSLLSAVATSMGPLLAGRALQGAAGGLFPLAFAIIRDEFPPEKVAAGLGIFSSLLGIGSGAGVVLAGPIVDGLGYHWLFWIPLIVGAVAAVATWAFVPESPVKTGGRVDWAGAALLSVGLLALLLAVSRTTEWGWGSAKTLGLGAIGALILAFWVRAEHRVRDPLVDMRMMRIRGVWTTNAVSGLLGVGMYAAFILLPQYVQEPKSTGYGFGGTVTDAGVYLLPMTVMLVLAGSQAGRIDRVLGARRALIAACLINTGAWIVLLLLHTEGWQLYLVSALLGAGNGLQLAALPILITRTVRQEQTGIANGMNNVMRTIGGAVGGQIAATFLAHDLLRGQPTEHGYVLAFAIGAIALAAAFLVSLLVPHGPRAADHVAATEFD